MKKILLGSVLGIFFLAGCGASDSSLEPASGSSVIYTSSSTKKGDYGYMYNRANNLEDMDTNSIEKLKKAVAMLIDKVNALEAKGYSKSNPDNEKINNEISGIKRDLGTLKAQQVNNETTVKVNPPISPDDDQIIMNFLNSNKENKK